MYSSFSSSYITTKPSTPTATMNTTQPYITTNHNKMRNLWFLFLIICILTIHLQPVHSAEPCICSSCCTSCTYTCTTTATGSTCTTTSLATAPAATLPPTTL